MRDMRFARNEFGIYRIRNLYERDRGENNLCIQLGDLLTGDFVGEAYASDFKLAKYLPELIQADDYINGNRVIENVRVEVTKSVSNTDIFLDFKVVTAGKNGNAITYSYKQNEIHDWVTSESFNSNKIKFKEVLNCDGI